MREILERGDLMLSQRIKIWEAAMAQLSLFAVPIWVGITVVFVATRILIDSRYPDRARMFDAAD
jgi:hypothetical protein